MSTCLLTEGVDRGVNGEEAVFTIERAHEFEAR